MESKESTLPNSENMMAFHETNTNDRHIDYLFGTMNFEICDLKGEMYNLDQTCSIGVTYNRPPKTKFSEFKQVLDIIFNKRIIELIINLSFLSKECSYYLLEKLRGNRTMKRLTVIFIKEDYVKGLLESVEDICGLDNVNLRCNIKAESTVAETVSKSIIPLP